MKTNFEANIADIHGGRGRIKIGASLKTVARFFRGGVTRERIRQIEASKQPSEAVARDYLAALAKIVEMAQRLS